MNVYISNVACSFGGGMILVAANSPEEALAVAYERSAYRYLFGGWNCDLEGIELKISSDLTPFELLEGMSFDTDKPRVIQDNIYME